MCVFERDSVRANDELWCWSVECARDLSLERHETPVNTSEGHGKAQLAYEDRTAGWKGAGLKGILSLGFYNVLFMLD